MVGVLQDMQEGAPRVVQAVGLTSQAAAIVLIVVQDVEHRLALIAEALIDVVEIAHDVQQSATALLGLPDAHLQFFPALAQGRAGGDQRVRFDLFQPRGFFHGAVAATHCFGSYWLKATSCGRMGLFLLHESDFAQLGDFLSQAVQLFFQGDHFELAADHHFLEFLQVQDFLL